MENWGKQIWVTKHEVEGLWRISKTSAAFAEVYWSACWFCRKNNYAALKIIGVGILIFYFIKIFFQFMLYLSGGKTYQPALVYTALYAMFSVHLCRQSARLKDVLDINTNTNGTYKILSTVWDRILNFLKNFNVIFL